MTYGTIYDKLIDGSYRGIGYLNKNAIISKCKQLVNDNFNFDKGSPTVAYKAVVMKQEILSFNRRKTQQRLNRKMKVKRLYGN